MATYSKSALVKDVAAQLNHSQTAVNDITDALFAKIAEQANAGNNVTLIGVGTFKVKHSEARTGRNPRTGAPVEIAASSRLTFKASKPSK